MADIKKRVAEILSGYDLEDRVEIMNMCVDEKDVAYDDLSVVAQDARAVADLVSFGHWTCDRYFTYDGHAVYSIEDIQWYIDDRLDDIVEAVTSGRHFEYKELNDLSEQFLEVDVSLTREDINALSEMFYNYRNLAFTFTKNCEVIGDNIMAVNNILERLGA